MGDIAITRAGRRLRWPLALAGLSALALAGTLVSGPAAGTAFAARALTRAGTTCPHTPVSAATALSWQENGRASVPWRGVGRGWILADVTSSPGGSGRGTLYLVSPGGHRYALGPDLGGSLQDWSGDGARALLLRQSMSSSTATIIVLDLKTGQASSFGTYSSAGGFSSAAFTRPGGQGILFEGDASSSGGYLPLQKFGLAGTRQRCYPAAFQGSGRNGGFLENAAGTEIVLNTADNVELVSNGGQVIRNLTQAKNSCNVLNWWSSQAVVTVCNGSNGGQLEVVPLSGAKPTALTGGNDNGTFVGAWHLPSGNYAEAAACGTTWLEKLNPDFTATRLTIPGAANAGNVNPLGTFGNEMPIIVAAGCDQSGFRFSEIDWYNPSANTAVTVLGGPSGTGWVQTGVLFPGS